MVYRIAPLFITLSDLEGHIEDHGAIQTCSAEVSEVSRIVKLSVH